MAGVGATPARAGVGAAAPTPRPAPRETPDATTGFYNPELTSGLLSENVTPVQREGLGRLARFLRMQPREVLNALRTGTGLGFLLSARRLAPSALMGMFDKGLLIDAQA